MSSRFDAVLFDCDGVLVDSEPITNGVLRDMLHEQGWSLTLAECMRIFVGHAVRDHRALIEQRTGRPLSDEWLAQFRQRRNEQLASRLQPVPGAAAAVEAVHRRLKGRIACASGADLHKVQLQLAKTGLLHWFEGRVFSGHDLPRSKPWPDVYLAAAAAVGVPPARCLVVEDTVPGATAGIAAGAQVLGYSPPELGHDGPRALREAGAFDVIDDMARVPEFLG